MCLSWKNSRSMRMLLWSGLEKALRAAFEQFVDSRMIEGENLKKDLCDKLDNMLSYVDYIEERSPQIIQAYRLKLEEKIKELLGDTGIDDSRIAQRRLRYLLTRYVLMKKP